MFISESTTLGMRTTHQYIIIIYYDIQYLDFLSLTRGWNPWSCSQLYTHIMNKLTFLFYVNKYITTYRESEMESNWMWYWGVFYQDSRKSILVDLVTTTGSRMTNNSINSICYWVYNFALWWTFNFLEQLNIVFNVEKKTCIYLIFLTINYL